MIRCVDIAGVVAVCVCLYVFTEIGLVEMKYCVMVLSVGESSVRNHPDRDLLRDYTTIVKFSKNNVSSRTSIEATAVTLQTISI